MGGYIQPGSEAAQNVQQAGQQQLQQQQQAFFDHWKRNRAIADALAKLRSQMDEHHQVGLQNHFSGLLPLPANLLRPNFQHGPPIDATWGNWWRHPQRPIMFNGANTAPQIG